MNKEKSKLVLVPTHNDFDKDGVLYRDEMLSWPMVNAKLQRIDLGLEKVYKDALTGLTQIHPFSAKVSLGVTFSSKHFTFPYRTWGVIYLNEKKVISFSHDTRVDNCPHKTILDWTEMMNFPSEENYEGEEKEREKVKKWSSASNWVLFYREQILKRIQDYLNASYEESIKNFAKLQKEIVLGHEVFNALYKQS